ncbi:MAG: TetR family transcriptional regulator C-terminal domain-containing protein [Actinobacteria bacterium]|nr:TetR family transcriptional regulator C-terminal domain-containing protein [Actinomycetota bacterium]
MPKQVDHEARRQRIADAVCRVAARQGLEGASLRHVAAEAGVSMGQVQHYFTTKDEMLLFAFHTLSARVERRLQATVQALAQPPSTRALLRALLVAMVATDAEGRFEAPLWVAFLARAVVEPDLAAPLRVGALVDFATDQLRAAQEAGEIPRSLDPELEATSLFALADGLMLRILLDPDHAATALAAVDYQLDRIFDGEGSGPAAQAPGNP